MKNSYSTFTVTECKMTLDEQEREWLHNVMQNPLFEGNPADEPDYDNNMRSKFWKATRNPNGVKKNE